MARAVGLARALGPLGLDDCVEADGARHAQHGGDMAVRQRALDGEGLIAWGQHDPALEDAAQTLDVLGWPMGEVEQRAFTHALAIPIALAEQDRGRGAAIGDGFDVHGRRIAQAPREINQNIAFTWLQILRKKGINTRKISRLTRRQERSSA